MTEIQRWGDDQQYRASEMKARGSETSGVMPRVTLLWMTPDPLGALAAACRMYEGTPTYDLEDLSDEERRGYWEDATSTHLKAPLEFVKFHFFLEGVDRAFTHQMVRQRTAVYAQESMRFAVVDDLQERSTLPPSLYGSVPQGDHETVPDSSRERQRQVWDNTLETVAEAYERLVSSGMPAEEARGLLPHATATRLNYCTDLRALLGHAGNRLCTQAQFHWRLVLQEMVNQIKKTGWQGELISRSFKPVCYQLGHCPFQASFDRRCSIRDRVELFSEHGVDSEEWGKNHTLVNDRELVRDDDAVMEDWQRIGNMQYPDIEHIPGISTEEWMLDPEAAR